jgi:hypothetical protein
VVFVDGELWQATASDAGGDPAAMIPEGTAVAVAAVDGLRLVVRPATAAETAGAGVAILPPPDHAVRRPTATGPVSTAPADVT